MIHQRTARQVASLAMLAALTACSAVPVTTDANANVNANTIPAIPAPAAVTLAAGTTALLVLDINAAVCQPNPACLSTVPAIVALINKARAANVPVLYSTTVSPSGPPPMLAAVAPQAGEAVVSTRANKFTATNLEELLKQKKVETLVIVGSAANGAVMYSSFHANTRGFTVVVAEDGISSPTPINTVLARYQLLNQPGFINAANTPLADKKVTLSRGDLITFK